MTRSNPNLDVAVTVSLSVVDRAAALAHVRDDLMRAGEGELGAGASDVEILAGLANPWRSVEGAEAIGLAIATEDGDHAVTVTFAVLDADLVTPSVVARFEKMGRRAPPMGTTSEALRHLMETILAAPGVEVQDSHVEEVDGDDFDAVLSDAATHFAPDVTLPLAA